MAASPYLPCSAALAASAIAIKSIAGPPALIALGTVLGPVIKPPFFPPIVAGVPSGP